MAGSLNKVMLIGRLGKDPDLRYISNGTAVANFSMATDESYTNKDGKKVERTEWHRIVSWGKQAEFCGNYLSKGRLVYVEGKLETRKWQDKSGADRYTTEIRAERISFMESKNAASNDQDGSARNEPVMPSEAPPMDAYDGGDSSMDGCPF